jgi:hypothetical protein
MFFAYLQKNKLLTSTIYQYVNDYWEDIIEMINNPDGDE